MTPLDVSHCSECSGSVFDDPLRCPYCDEPLRLPYASCWPEFFARAKTMVRITALIAATLIAIRLYFMG